METSASSRQHTTKHIPPNTYHQTHTTKHIPPPSPSSTPPQFLVRKVGEGLGRRGGKKPNFFLLHNNSPNTRDISCHAVFNIFDRFQFSLVFCLPASPIPPPHIGLIQWLLSPALMDAVFMLSFLSASPTFTPSKKVTKAPGAICNTFFWFTIYELQIAPALTHPAECICGAPFGN